MVRCLAKRKRGAGVCSTSTSSSTTTSNSNSNTAITSTIRTEAASIRIGYDSLSADEISDYSSGVCSIRDDHGPQSRQSSLLSFFAKAKKVKPKPKTTKHKSVNLTSSSSVSNTNTNVNTNDTPPSSSSSSSPSSSNLHRRSIEKSPLVEATAAASSSSSSSSSRHSSSQSRKSKSLTQVYIDCGQSKFGQILCDKCGMLYMPGIAEDESQHKQLCQAYTQGIPCVRGNVKGGKHVDKITTSGDDSATIVLWRPSVNVRSKNKYKQQQERIENNSNYATQTQHNKHLPSQWPLLAQMISKDLGTHEESTLDHFTNQIVFLYIGNNCGTANKNNNKNRNKNNTATNINTNRCRILGVATVQLLGQVHAYRMISLHERSLTPLKAKLGIGLLWTHPVARHRGIATRLVHAVRDHAVFGMRVARQDVAFSSPTQAGYDFALRYSNDDNGNDTRNIVFNDDDGDEGYNNNDSSCGGRRGPLVYAMNL